RDGGEAEGPDPAAALRGRDPGGDRQQDHRARDDPAAAQERDGEVLRRRHHAQAQAAREAEGREAADEAGGDGGDPAGGVPGGAPGRRVSMEIAVILSTYNWPRALELSLWGYAAQTFRDFQIVIADDGSGPETREVIERLRGETGLDIVHVWQEDRGFRKSEILNRAILATDRSYLIFSDADIIPRRDFVEVHARLAEPDRFLVGGAVKLPARVRDRKSVVEGERAEQGGG